MKEHDKDYEKRETIGSTTSTEAGHLEAKTPEWLRALEAQSWQSELLISGLIIAGLFQLPDFFIHSVAGFMIDASEMGHLFYGYASLFVLAAINSIIVFFGFHFFLRAIWVALLGLNSVYPDGINVHSTSGAGPKYWKRAKEKYPNLSAYNLQLDQQCSVIFSLASVILIVMTSISVIILLIYQLFRLLIAVFPVIADHVVPTLIGLYVLFMVVAFIMQHIAKRYPDNERIARITDRYGSGMRNLFSLYIFRKPVGYISSIYVTNTENKYFPLLIGIFSFFLGLAGARQIDDHPVFDNFDREKYITFNNTPHEIFPYNYDNLRPKDMQIFTPVIDSDQVKGDYVKLFIPTINREKEQMGLKQFSFWEKIHTKRSVRDSVHEAAIRQYATFNRIFVNDIAYSDLDFQYFTHPNANEHGVQVYIPSADFKKGKNVLEIRKNYFSKEGKTEDCTHSFLF